MGHYDTCYPDRCSYCGGGKHAGDRCPFQPEEGRVKPAATKKSEGKLWCPTPDCGKPIAATERRPNGDSICEDGHKCKTARALASQPKRRFELETVTGTLDLAAWSRLITRLIKEHGPKAILSIEAPHENVSAFIEKY
jgi:hypothetical protein